jgi:hypothetical protein
MNHIREVFTMIRVLLVGHFVSRRRWRAWEFGFSDMSEIMVPFCSRFVVFVELPMEATEI